MGVIKNFLLNFNIFQTQQFFRFDGNYEYNNLLGGFFSLLIRLFLMALLGVKLVGVFSYSNVLVTATTSYSITVTNTTLSPSNPKDPFLFAFEVVKQRTTLNTSAFQQRIVVWTTNTSGASTRLQLCTPQHWASSPKNYQLMVQAVDPSSLLYCLPVKFAHQISIAQEATLQISLAFNCVGNCSQVNYTSLLVRPIVLNKLINAPQSKEYISSFLDKRMYYPIDTQSYAFDTVLQYQLAKYSINTDNSLFPYQSVTTENGFLIPSQPYVSYRPNRFTTYTFFRTLYILRNQQYNYNRSFTKVFDAISLIGGLIPVFTILFIWLNYYALSRFEMTFIKRLHSDQKDYDYGLFYFFSKMAYRFLSLFKFEMKNWKQTKEYHHMHRTVNQLIDIIYLHRRLQFMERALEVLLEDHQIKVLHLMRNKTFKEAEDTYNRYQMKDNLFRLIQKRQRKEQARRRQQQAEGETKNSFIPNREILLEPLPQPSFKQSQQGQPSSKALHPVDQFERDIIVPENPGQKAKEGAVIRQPFELNEAQEKRSQDGSQRYQQKMNELQDAYESYQKLCCEAKDEKTGYFSEISRKILNKLDDGDRQVLEGLRTLLNQNELNLIIARILDTFSKKVHDDEVNSQRQLVGPRLKRNATMIDHQPVPSRKQLPRSKSHGQSYLASILGLSRIAEATDRKEQSGP